MFNFIPSLKTEGGKNQTVDTIILINYTFLSLTSLYMYIYIYSNSHRINVWTFWNLHWPLKTRLNVGYILHGTNISRKHGILKMIFLFLRWDMSIPWTVYLCRRSIHGSFLNFSRPPTSVNFPTPGPKHQVTRYGDQLACWVSWVCWQVPWRGNVVFSYFF